MNVPEVMNLAVGRMQEWVDSEFGKGFNFKIIEDLRRTEPCESYPIGKLGANIKLEFGEDDRSPVVLFLGCESEAEEMVCNPMGHFIVQEVATQMIKAKITDQ